MYTIVQALGNMSEKSFPKMSQRLPQEVRVGKNILGKKWIVYVCRKARSVFLLNNPGCRNWNCTGDVVVPSGKFGTAPSITVCTY